MVESRGNQRNPREAFLRQTMAVAEWAVSVEPPPPVYDGLGTSGGTYVVVGGIREYVPERLTLDDWWPQVRRAYWMHRASELCRDRGHSAEFLQHVIGLVKERAWQMAIEERGRRDIL